MKLEIDIPFELYNSIVNYNINFSQADDLCRAVVTGKRVSEEHNNKIELINDSEWKFEYYFNPEELKNKSPREAFRKMNLTFYNLFGFYMEDELLREGIIDND